MADRARPLGFWFLPPRLATTAHVENRTPRPLSPWTAAYRWMKRALPATKQKIKHLNEHLMRTNAQRQEQDGLVLDFETGISDE